MKTDNRTLYSSFKSGMNSTMARTGVTTKQLSRIGEAIASREDVSDSLNFDLLFLDLNTQDAEQPKKISQ